MKAKLKKINTWASWIWLGSVVAFALVIALSTNFMSKDPTYGAEGAEHVWLLPMLASVGLGMLSFGVMLLAGLVSRLTKGEGKYKPPLGFSAYKATAGVVLIFVMAGVYLWGMRQNYQAHIYAQYDGQGLFDAVNQYREENGVPKVKVNPIICDNLVERHRVISSGDVGHEGFEQWAEGEGISSLGFTLAELYTKNTATTDDAIGFWESSPGHRTSLMNPTFTDGCAYVNQDVSVLVLGTKNYSPE